MKLTVRETVVFGMLGAVMYCSKMIMEFAPNIHLLGVFTMAFTLVYRKKALYPIYTFVLITGVMNGFAGWLALAALRYAFLISSSEALLPTPSTS